MVTPGGNESANQILDSIELLFQRSVGLFGQHVTDLEAFREQVSKKLLVVCREMGELKEMFEVFEAAQQDKTNNKEWLADRKNLYEHYLKIDADKIIACLQDSIKNGKQQLEALQKAKEQKIQGIFKILI